jgi:hypothetical protein
MSLFCDPDRIRKIGKLSIFYRVAAQVVSFWNHRLFLNAGGDAQSQFGVLICDNILLALEVGY